jgi:hypothetical protein
LAKTENRKAYNTLKDWNGQKYTGMSIGGKHSWNYTNGLWNEMKTAPDEWKFDYSSLKSRIHQAPPGTGAPDKTAFNWYIIATQEAIKLDENTYSTMMKGLKFKLGHRRHNWKGWSYTLKHESYEDKIIKILQNAIKQLKAKKKERELFHYF